MPGQAPAAVGARAGGVADDAVGQALARLQREPGKDRLNPRAVQGAGRYVKRPAFGPNFDAVAKRTHELAPTAVQR